MAMLGLLCYAACRNADLPQHSVTVAQALRIAAGLPFFIFSKLGVGTGMGVGSIGRRMGIVGDQFG